MPIGGVSVNSHIVVFNIQSDGNSNIKLIIIHSSSGHISLTTYSPWTSYATLKSDCSIWAKVCLVSLRVVGTMNCQTGEHQRRRFTAQCVQKLQFEFSKHHLLSSCIAYTYYCNVYFERKGNKEETTKFLILYIQKQNCGFREKKKCFGGDTKVSRGAGIHSQ